MVQLKKGKEAPAPFVEDFPGLGPSQGPSSSARPDSSAKNSAGANANSKKKNKGKKNGFLIGEDALPSAEQSSSKGKYFNKLSKSIFV